MTAIKEVGYINKIGRKPPYFSEGMDSLSLR